eukprot:TRINITY_DN2834_c0_g2_i2.p1 TRINITY_DN2834_c0_g2~~TRINITY_DN2834_c0_g2_i2.p1  ORF type:complete len:160 (-),score=6.57 TRINITY_DN2834_c0_g2_i2:889-1368(-)
MTMRAISLIRRNQMRWTLRQTLTRNRMRIPRSCRSWRNWNCPRKRNIDFVVDDEDDGDEYDDEETAGQLLGEIDEEEEGVTILTGEIEDAPESGESGSEEEQGNANEDAYVVPDLTDEDSDPSEEEAEESEETSSSNELQPPGSPVAYRLRSKTVYRYA